MQLSAIVALVYQYHFNETLETGCKCAFCSFIYLFDSSIPHTLTRKFRLVIRIQSTRLSSSRTPTVCNVGQTGARSSNGAIKLINCQCEVKYSRRSWFNTCLCVFVFVTKAGIRTSPSEACPSHFDPCAHIRCCVYITFEKMLFNGDVPRPQAESSIRREYK